MNVFLFKIRQNTTNYILTLLTFQRPKHQQGKDNFDRGLMSFSMTMFSELVLLFGATVVGVSTLLRQNIIILSDVITSLRDH